MREHHVTLRDRVNVAGESKGLQIVEKLEFEERHAVGAAQLRKVGEIIRLKFKILKVIDGVTQAACDGVASLERLLAKREVEDRFVLQHPLFPITVGHGELIKVSQKGGRNSVFRRHR